MCAGCARLQRELFKGTDVEVTREMTDTFHATFNSVLEKGGSVTTSTSPASWSGIGQDFVSAYDGEGNYDSETLSSAMQNYLQFNASQPGQTTNHSYAPATIEYTTNELTHSDR